MGLGNLLFRKVTKKGKKKQNTNADVCTPHSLLWFLRTLKPGMLTRGHRTYATTGSIPLFAASLAKRSSRSGRDPTPMG